MRFFYTLSIILLITLQASGQSRQESLPPQDEVSVKFYPNPATTKITFDFEKSYNRNYSFQVFNFMGKKVFELAALTSPKATIDLTDYFRGVYIFQLRDTNGKVIKSGRFQVAR